MTEVPEQTGLVEDAIFKLTGRFALTVTVCVADFGPLQPTAITVMMLEPFQLVVKLTVPVAASMVFPPIKDAASRLYVIPLLLVAVAL